MDTLAESRIDAYLSALSSAAPTPGGGAVAGLTAAQAAALLLMVCNLSRSKRYAAVAAEIGAIHDACQALRDRLSALADADTAAFRRVAEAQRMPRGTDRERAARRRAVEPALKEAAAVPLDMLERAAELVPYAQRLAAIGNANAITDVGVAVRLIEAAAHSARLNVLINIRDLADARFVADCEGRLSRALERVRLTVAPCLDAVERLVAGDRGRSPRGAG